MALPWRQIMNPNPIALAYGAAQSAREQRAREENEARLHKAAVARRRKRKRGGKK